MANETSTQTHHVEDVEIQEWLESLDSCWRRAAGRGTGDFGKIARARDGEWNRPAGLRRILLTRIRFRCGWSALFPGDQELERRIKSLIRWNALAMVVRANREEHNIGGHISTFASAATLYEIGFNHFWRGRSEAFEGDTIYFQGHAAPGMYARGVHGRATEQREAGEFPA